MDENALRAAGIDYEAALARFMGKQAIYEKAAGGCTHGCGLDGIRAAG